MKQFIRDYLTFNKRERNGVFVLIAIITLLLFYLNISDKLVKTETVDFTKFENETRVLNASMAQEDDSLKQEQQKNYTSAIADRPVKSKADYFNFDPNNLPEADWKRLGLNDKQIHIIKNYEAKGGKFKTKEDVKKMYCINEKMHLSLEPYIKIEQLAVGNRQMTNDTKSAIVEYHSIELNSADSAELVSLKGIGAFYAKTIIKYRNSLGGFVATEQLMEVWKFDIEKFDGIEKQITVDVSKIKKININNCTASELKHPYLKWNMVNAIINYRDKHGNYKTVEEIKKTDLVDDETFRKIAPYLIVE